MWVGLTRLQKKKGLVSEAGLERLAQRHGFDCLPEDYTSPADGRKMRALIIAGSSTQIEIVLDNNIVQHVTLAFPESGESTSRHMEPASRMLLRDLRLRRGQSPLTKSLDDFADNLARLASLDRLSITPAFDCRAALAGVYTSLERLYRWDLEQLRTGGAGGAGGPVESERMASLLAMCTRHGRPAMHPRGRIGLALQYWRERRLVAPSSEPTAALADDRERIWSLGIGCAPMASGGTGINGLQMQPARVSDDWISPDVVVKQQQPQDGNNNNPDAEQQQLDWREPDNVRLPPASADNKDHAIEMMQPDLTTARVPAVVFTATFDPPVVLPQSDFLRLYASAGMDTPAPPVRPPTFDQLLFPTPDGVYPDPSERRTILRTRSVAVPPRPGSSSSSSSAGSATVTHNNSLFIYKQIYSMELSEVAFSHPKQLVHMLPCLRQWAFTSTLLSNSFGTRDAAPTVVPATATAAAAAQADPSGARPDVVAQSAKDRLADFMAASLDLSRDNAPPAAADRQADPELSLDVTLWVHPAPHFQVIFPFGDSRADLMLQICENGAVEVVHENVLALAARWGGGAAASSYVPSSSAAQQQQQKQHQAAGVTRQTLAKALEHMEDLCKWAEWIRSRLGPQGVE